MGHEVCFECIQDLLTYFPFVLRCPECRYHLEGQERRDIQRRIDVIQNNGPCLAFFVRFFRKVDVIFRNVLIVLILPFYFTLPNFYILNDPSFIGLFCGQIIHFGFTSAIAADVIHAFPIKRKRLRTYGWFSLLSFIHTLMIIFGECDFDALFRYDNINIGNNILLLFFQGLMLFAYYTLLIWPYIPQY